MKQILCLFIGLAVFAMSGCGRIENDRAREVKNCHLHLVIARNVEEILVLR